MKCDQSMSWTDLNGARNGTCPYTKLDLEKEYEGDNPLLNPSIDQTKAGGGYIKDNGALTVLAFNLLASDHPKDLAIDAVLRMAASLLKSGHRLPQM